MRATTAVVDYAALAAHRGTCPAQTAGSVFNILQVEKQVVAGEAAGTAGGQARHFRRLSWASPCRHVGHQLVYRHQGYVTWSQQQRGRMGQELPAV